MALGPDAPPARTFVTDVARNEKEDELPVGCHRDLVSLPMWPFSAAGQVACRVNEGLLFTGRPSLQSTHLHLVKNLLQGNRDVLSLCTCF